MLVLVAVVILKDLNFCKSRSLSLSLPLPFLFLNIYISYMLYFHFHLKRRELYISTNESKCISTYFAIDRRDENVSSSNISHFSALACSHSHTHFLSFFAACFVFVLKNTFLRFIKLYPYSFCSNNNIIIDKLKTFICNIEFIGYKYEKRYINTHIILSAAEKKNKTKKRTCQSVG